MSEPEKRLPEELVASLIGGLQSVFHSVQTMASSGAQQVRQTVFPSGTGFNGVYGFTLKADLGKPSVTVEPFGNVQADAATGRTVVAGYREPPTEIAEDAAVVAATPGTPGAGTSTVPA